jgi:DNA-binding SARP family transcriptional activator
VAYALFHSDFESGIDHANQLLRWDKARERTHYDLMRLYALAGERTAALNQFELCRSILQEELGVEPAAQTVALYNTLRSQNFATTALPHRELNYTQDLHDLLRTLEQVSRQVALLQHDLRRELALQEGRPPRLAGPE